MTSEDRIQREMNALATQVPNARMILLGGISPSRELLVVVEDEAERSDAASRLRNVPPTTPPLRIVTQDELNSLQTNPAFNIDFSVGGPVAGGQAGLQPFRRFPFPDPLGLFEVKQQDPQRSRRARLRDDVAGRIGPTIPSMLEVEARLRDARIDATTLSETWPAGDSHRTDWVAFTARLEELRRDAKTLLDNLSNSSSDLPTIN